MSTSRKLYYVSIALSIVGIGLVVIERAHHGWWPF